MSRREKAPLIIIISLLVFFALAATMIFFGARMALYRAEQRALADPVMARVIETDSRVVTSRDSDGRTTSTTERTFIVEVNIFGEVVRRTMIAANFDPEDHWFNGDEVDPTVFQEGARVPVLVRRDLNFAVTPADFWSAYLVPVILMGFGGFITAFLGLWSFMFFRR